MQVCVRSRMRDPERMGAMGVQVCGDQDMTIVAGGGWQWMCTCELNRRWERWSGEQVLCDSERVFVRACTSVRVRETLQHRWHS